jgi:hypothetical protein
MRLQTLVFGLQLGQAERALHREVEQLGLKRFGQEVVGAHGHRPQGIGLVVLPGQHDHLGVGSAASICSSSLKPSETRIRVGRQPQIHGDHGRHCCGASAPAHFAVVRGDRLELVE